ncbi:PIN domain-containing protein [Schaalia georgiae]|uniref:PIN domain-containing protein n=1 Tax=Schaalia georgiae TaxID=52768 RepID=UPI00047B34DD|nr:PIN domain-containing protein [Schaalia georgiae]
MSAHPYHTVLVDANVWYSRTLRDWVCMLATEAEGDLYTVLWTDDILAECTYHLRKANPRWEGGKTSRIRELIEEVFPDGRVRDFVVEGGALDEGDQHVHAAAVAGGADFVLTMNVKDFPGGDECPYEVYTPGEFFMLVWDSAPGLVERVSRKMDCYWSGKGHLYSVAERLRSAEKSAAMQEFAQRVARALCDR